MKDSRKGKSPKEEESACYTFIQRYSYIAHIAGSSWMIFYHREKQIEKESYEKQSFLNRFHSFQYFS